MFLKEKEFADFLKEYYSRKSFVIFKKIFIALIFIIIAIVLHFVFDMLSSGFVGIMFLIVSFSFTLPFLLLLFIIFSICQKDGKKIEVSTLNFIKKNEPVNFLL